MGKWPLKCVLLGVNACCQRPSQSAAVSFQAAANSAGVDSEAHCINAAAQVGANVYTNEMARSAPHIKVGLAAALRVGEKEGDAEVTQPQEAERVSFTTMAFCFELRVEIE
jgi:hypothetical protein